MRRLPDIQQVLPGNRSLERVGHDAQVHHRVTQIGAGVSLFQPLPDRSGSYVHPLPCPGFPFYLSGNEPCILLLSLNRHEHQAATAGFESQHLQHPVGKGAIEPACPECNICLVRIRNPEQVWLAAFSLDNGAHSLNGCLK